MDDREMWWGRTDTHSLLTPTLPLTSALKTFSIHVSAFATCASLSPPMPLLSYFPTETAVMNPSRHVELDIDIGADAKDWSAIQAGERLKPTEMELRRIEEVMGEVVKEMEYLKEREFKLRDTNESTNERVKWFAILTMFSLVILGAWQVVYLRAYFR